MPLLFLFIFKNYYFSGAGVEFRTLCKVSLTPMGHHNTDFREPGHSPVINACRLLTQFPEWKKRGGGMKRKKARKRTGVHVYVRVGRDG